MAARPPSSPPVIPGFESIRLLGSGGFADVFLYQQSHPRRQVAVKVLLKERMAASTIAGFTEEANVMAQFANHPSIVAVYQAGVSDDGRPYLVMEYCSKPNLQMRHRAERFSEADTLRIGIQIAGAIETTHRAGILHRDIKPANILVTEYGKPKLTDFGISAAGGQELVGMSIPWSPPESLAVPPTGTAASDVYSLAATLYTLLVNRTPFQIVGGANSEIDVISRIQAAPLPPLGRHDVSEELEAVLRRAMAKRPEDRYASALEFARALQRVQIGLGMQPTSIDVVEEELASTPHDDGEEETRFRGIVRIDAQTGTTVPGASTASVAPAGTTVPDPTKVLGGSPAGPSADTSGATRHGALGAAAGLAAPLDDASVVRPPDTVSPAQGYVAGPVLGDPGAFAAPIAAAVDETIVRESAAPSQSPPEASPKRRRGARIGLLVGGVALLAAVVTIALVVVPPGSAAPKSSSSPDPIDVGSDQPVDVKDLKGIVTGDQVAFMWTDPDPKKGDTYRWRPVVAGQESTFQTSTAATATVPVAAGGRTCIQVLLVRASGVASADGVQGCAP
ncbi:serine/threonine-protein kinase [Microbacterium capsulatum]|uniref:non-specific serine/threonine protein kinase n=1 Tax=Microbacterium capsulatum TaxID=3041921 RepID=A0ABU0XEG5_9MICO|nr:serine/threonine-protein kinase [Microbacterium sp. ASV81]MDQ4213456.1 serine/threonine-protein kinase [Microbacterium sp. ASV81]